MTDKDWKARAVGCEAEAKRLAGDLAHTKAELERVTGYLLEARSHIQAAALSYEWNKINDPAPVHLRTVDHAQKIQDCRRLFDLIEAIEDTRFETARGLAGTDTGEGYMRPGYFHGDTG